MTANNILLALKHFVKVVKWTKEDKVLFILDIHKSHVNLNVVLHANITGVRVIRPLPKAPPRKLRNGCRKRGSTRIITDTGKNNISDAETLEKLKKTS